MQLGILFDFEADMHYPDFKLDLYDKKNSLREDAEVVSCDPDTVRKGLHPGFRCSTFEIVRYAWLIMNRVREIVICASLIFFETFD